MNVDAILVSAIHALKKGISQKSFSRFRTKLPLNSMMPLLNFRQPPITKLRKNFWYGSKTAVTPVFSSGMPKIQCHFCTEISLTKREYFSFLVGFLPVGSSFIFKHFELEATNRAEIEISGWIGG